jgi:hypothetical protein
VFAVGETTVIADITLLGCQVNPLTAATPVSVEVDPWHIIVGVASTATASGATVIVVVDTVVPQPF